jgi:predicted RNA-binding protein with PUA-like domain
VRPAINTPNILDLLFRQQWEYVTKARIVVQEMKEEATMNYWIFQAVPERYDLRERLVEGEEVTWYATRYRSYMSAGDLVFFWLGGPESIRGIYGWGRLISSPYMKPELETYGVDVQYEKRLGSHVAVRTVKSIPGLQDLLLLRAPQATNFRLSSQEARAIVNLIEPDQRPEGV